MLKIGDRVLTQTDDAEYNEKFGFIKEVGDSQSFRVHLDGEFDASYHYVTFGVEELVKVKS